MDVSNITYNYKGEVFCHCPIDETPKTMAFGGFEKDRETLKYLCPVNHYGMECKYKKNCPIKNSIRIPLKEDRRIFTPMARSSYKWQELYNTRAL